MTDLGRMQRRDFLKALAAASWSWCACRLELAELPEQQRGYPTDVNAYLHIAETGR